MLFVEGKRGSVFMANLVEAVIIGSGFGGSIPALRLAQANKSVLVLEDGYSYTEKDFRQSWDPKYLIQMNRLVPSDDYAVFYRFGRVLGGSSVVFSGLMNRAPSEAFQFVDDTGYKVWPDAINRKVLDPYYDMVESMMQVRQATWNEVPKTGGMFAKMMANMGLTCDRARFPYVNCRQCGFCEAGCIFGAKQSLMHNYIPQAQGLGVEFRTGCRVRKISVGSSGYTVTYLDKDGRESHVESTIVILAAGAIGSAEILLRSMPYLPELSNQVGKNFNNNGDLIIGFLLPEGLPSVEYYKGRTNSSVMTYSFWYSHQITIHTGTGPPAIFSGLNIHEPGKRAWGLEYKHWTKQVYPSRLIMCVVIGLVTGEGYVYLSNDTPVVHFPITEGFSRYINKVVSVGEGIAKANKAILLQTRASGYEYTANHMLGTCRMGDDPSRSVADPYGQVWGYSGLFVSDSGSIPGGCGVNLALTVAANAERIANYIVTHW